MSENPFDAEVIIIGSGAAGAAAAFALSDRSVLMLDVGYPPPAEQLPPVSISESILSGEDILPRLFDLGTESGVLSGKPQVSVKLKGPLLQFVSRRPTSLPEDLEAGFTSTQSFSRGGLANAWGAGAMRYSTTELKHFPIEVEDLKRWFNKLTEEIGISGSPDDDLAIYFGETTGLLAPHGVCPLAERLLTRYQRRKESFHQSGIRIGRPRLAILPVDYRGRRKFQHHGQEFFSSGHEGIYSPRMTVDRLIQEGKLQYRGGLLVERFEEQNDGVKIFSRDLLTGEVVTFRSRELLLAAGTLNTSRIVLQSRDDTQSSLPLLDNPVSFLPVIDPLRIGTPMPRNAFTSAELSIVIERGELPVQGSIYNLMGPLRSDLLMEFPLTLNGNLAACRELLPAMLMIQLFYPDRPNQENSLTLTPDGRLQIRHRAARGPGVERFLARKLLGAGLLAPYFLTQRPIAGSSIHYAGTLPMKHSPSSPYETNPDGVISCFKRVRAVDASVFPLLPAKNHTLMVMANSARIAELVKR